MVKNVFFFCLYGEINSLHIHIQCILAFNYILYSKILTPETYSSYYIKAYYTYIYMYTKLELLNTANL